MHFMGKAQNIIYWRILECSPGSPEREILFNALQYIRRQECEPNPYWEHSKPTGFVSVNGKELEATRQNT